jgi:hypothetical protein
VEDHRLAEEVPHEGGRRLFIETAWRPDLLHASLVHHRDAVGEAESLDLIMRDEEHGDAEAALEELHLYPHLLA